MKLETQQKLIEQAVKEALGQMHLQLIIANASVGALEEEVQSLKAKLVKAKLGSQPEGEEA